MPKGQKTKTSDWLVLIEEWQQSHLSKKAFCATKVINYRNFRRWCSRLIQPRKIEAAKTASSLPIKSALFVPVDIQPVEKLNTSAKPLVLILNQQLQLQIPVESVDGSLLSILFKSLGVLSC